MKTDRLVWVSHTSTSAVPLLTHYNNAQLCHVQTFLTLVGVFTGVLAANLLGPTAARLLPYIISSSISRAFSWCCNSHQVTTSTLSATFLNTTDSKLFILKSHFYNHSFDITASALLTL